MRVSVLCGGRPITVEARGATLGAEMKAFAIGPLVLPYTWFTGMAALALGFQVGQRVARRTGARDVGPHLFHVLLAGLLGARIAFVLRFWSAYRQSPWSIPDVRDGGWAPVAGIIVAIGYAFWLDRGVAGLRKPIVAGALAASCAGAVGAGVVVALPPPARSAVLPDVRLPVLTGGSVSLADFRGKPVVVNMWATWCPPCVRELPTLVRAQAAHPEIRFVFVAQEDSPQRVRAFLSSRHLAPRNVLLDADGTVAARFGSRALPTTLFFDSRGRLRAARMGALSAATLAQRLGPISEGAR